MVASRAALAAARIPAADLVGGASRYPLVATVLHQAFGVAPTAVEQPELAVAEGAVRPGPSAGEGAPPGQVPETDAKPSGRRFSRRATALAAGVATVTIAAAVALALRGETDGSSPQTLLGATATTRAPGSASPTPTPALSPTPVSALEDYLFSPTVLSVQDGGNSREYTRVSTTPAPAPKV